jgi:hypothetical protein
MFAGVDDPRTGTIVTGERDGAPEELDIVGIGGLTLDGPGAPMSLGAWSWPCWPRAARTSSSSWSRLPPPPALSRASLPSRVSMWQMMTRRPCAKRRCNSCAGLGCSTKRAWPTSQAMEQVPRRSASCSHPCRRRPAGESHGGGCLAGARLGIGVVSLGPQSRGAGGVHLTVAAEGDVVECVSSGWGSDVAGAALHRLNASEAIELLRVLAAGRGGAVPRLPEVEA